MTQPTTMKRLYADDGSYAGVCAVTADDRIAQMFRYRPGVRMELTRMSMAVRLGITRILLERRA
jgi:hypothetical protein